MKELILNLSSEIPEERFEYIYNNYSRAMNSRRPGSEINSQKFFDYLNSDVYYYRYQNSYIFFQEQDGVYIATHFAPATKREGFFLIKSLLGYCNVMFAVTNDLRKNLKRMGYKEIPFSKHIKNFRGQKVIKYLLVPNLYMFLLYIVSKKQYIIIKDIYYKINHLFFKIKLSLFYKDMFK